MMDDLKIHKEFMELWKQMALATLEYNQRMDKAFNEWMDNDPFLSLENEPEVKYKWNLQR